MNISRKGVTSISDDDEYFFESGVFELQLNQKDFHNLLIAALKSSPEFYYSGLFKLLNEVYSGEQNEGICCSITFRSNIKNLICPKCGKKVSLT